MTAMASQTTLEDSANAMQSLKTLKLNVESGTLSWSWTEAPIACELASKEIDLDTVQLTLNRAWKNVIKATREHDFNAAITLLAQQRRQLAHDLIPNAFDLSQIAPEGSLVAVEVFPDWLPLEILSAGDKPFGVRYQTLHLKRTKNGSMNRERLGHSTEEPAAQLTMMHNLLRRSAEQHQQHLHDIRGILDRIYGRARTLAIHNDAASGNLSRVVLADALCNPNLDCLYHLGHGGSDENGDGLEAADGLLDVETLRIRLRDVRLKGGFAFLNACRSVAAEGSGQSDIAQLLIEHGRHAVLGSVLSPLDAHAASFAKSVFDKLETGQTVLQAHHHSVVESWHRFQEFQSPSITPHRDSFDLSWACYRLYGSPIADSLRTLRSEPNGDFVVRLKQGRSISFGRLGSFERAVLTRILPVDTQEMKLADLFDFFAQYKELYEFRPMLVKAALSESRTEVLALLQQDAGHAVVSDFRSVEDATDIFWRIVVQSNRVPVDIDDLPSPFRKQYVGNQNQRFRASILSTPSIQRILSLAWQLARETACSKLDETHLFASAVVEAFSDYPSEIHSVGSLLVPALSDISDDAWLVLEKVTTLTEQPGLQIVRNLGDHDHLPFVRSARQAGLNFKIMAEQIERRRHLLAATRTADICNGRLVGMFAGAIPQTALRKWENALDAIVAALGRGLVVVRLPWHPVPSALVDVFAAHIMRRGKAAQCAYADRFWIHLTGEDLTRMNKPKARLKNVFLQNISNIVSHLAENGVLVVSDVRTADIAGVHHFLANKSLHSVPILLLLSHHMCEERLDTGLPWGSMPEPLEAMTDLHELRQFIVEWDAARHSAGVGSSYEEAINALVEQVWKIWPQHLMLDESVETLEAARNVARNTDEGLCPRHITIALNNLRRRPTDVSCDFGQGPFSSSRRPK